ncbi:MAG: N-acetylglucosamine kinase [Terriglobia bacterium]
MSFFLGIDAGGSKTECVLADAAGSVLARATSGGANLQRISAAELHTTLRAALEELRRTAGLSFLVTEAVCAGFAGAGLREPRALARDVLAALLRPRYLYVVGDMEVALEAAVGAGPGVVLVAGTGSIAYGRNQLGQQARAGGRGPLLDEGSGFDIGRHGLALLRPAEDARGPTTRLTRLVRQSLGANNIDELGAPLSPQPVAALAALVPHVVKAARSGDAHAQEILQQAGTALARLALTVLGELGLRETEVRVATAGGVFSESAEVFARVREEIGAAAPRAVVEPLGVAPADGAVRLAQRLWLQEQARAPA